MACRDGAPSYGDSLKASQLVHDSFEFVFEMFSFWVVGIVGVGVSSSGCMKRTSLTEKALIISVMTCIVFSFSYP